jgi:uncharacterized membrane protein YkvA (DUF1232 family)
VPPPTEPTPGADTAATTPDAAGPRVPRALWREAIALLPDLGRLLRGLWRDPRTPRRARALAGATAAYVAAPVDLLPDLVPGVGGVDDLLLVLWALRRIVAIAGYDLVRELWTGTDDGFAVLVVLAGIDD